MQYIPGSSVTLSATLSYLQRNQPLPDDSEVQTHIPQICVDYLSHEWQEEDVWKSWRNMTRHKSEITNGVRLENASWRTWWKQRNKLKTVSPETLNWLKDSDVTWLYGPLHTAAEPVPPPKQSTAEERLNLVKATGKKPILKHRTITELLLHAHEHGNHAPAIGSPSLEAVSMDLVSPTDDDPSDGRTGSPRPTLPHTKSDSQIVRIGSASGKDSPPRVTLAEPAGDPSASRSLSPAGSEGLPGSVSNLSLNATPARRHISFNTYVEQYISIEDPSATNNNLKRRTPINRRGAFYDSDDDVVYDDEEDDEESSASSILEMHHPGQVVGARRPNERGPTPVLRSNSTSQERERMTIAPIPPTILKAAEDLPAPSPQVVYAPPKEFIWDQGEIAAPSSGESSDNLASNIASGSITGQSVDMGFVAPQWGRPPAAPGSVGKGSTGPVGPTGVFQSDPYAASGYEEPAKPEAPSTDGPPQQIGLLAGRTKWVPGSAIPDDEDEEAEEDDSGDEAAENSTTEDEDEEATPAVGRDLGATTNASSSVSGSTTSSSANGTIIAGSPPVVGSPPSTVRSTSSRGSASQQPSRGILKKSSVGGGSAGGSSVHGVDDLGSSSGIIARHSSPIGIPKTSISHPTPPPSAMHMPPTATMSTASTSNLGGSSNNMLASAGFLSPTQETVLFFGPAGGVGGNGPPASGRGRTSTRSASSSGLSDRSRSSSKISGGTGSPLGSVSPSGYGSPSGSRASSVLGNRRSSTDVGVAVAGGRGTIRRENGSGVSARNSSTSPPVVSSPLATNSLQASSLGTIVANVPMDYSVVPERGGPPLSRSGLIAGSRMGGVSSSAPARPKMGSRTSSSSSVTSSTASSGSSSETANVRTPRVETARMVLPAAPAAAVSVPLPVEAVAKKPSTSGLVLPDGPRPTVIISPQQQSSSGDPSAGTSMSMDARDSKLEEEMRKVKAAAAAASKKGEVSDPEEVESGTFQEYKTKTTTIPTPSNSPVLGLSKALGGVPNNSKRPPAPAAASINSPSASGSTSMPPRSPPPPPPPVNGNVVVSPASTPRRSSFQSATSQPSSKAVVSPGTAVITPPSASAPALTPTEGESGIVGMAANSLVSSAKGMLGAIWSLGGEGVKQQQ